MSQAWDDDVRMKTDVNNLLYANNEW